MTLYRFIFSDGTTTFAAMPNNALIWGAFFARWRRAELLEIEEIRPLIVQFVLPYECA